jgi:hypothetical protein
MKAIASLAVLLVFVVGAACSGDDEASTTSPGTQVSLGGGGPSDQAAPDARLVDSSGKQTATPAGTRCWSHSCFDMIGPITAPKPTVVRAGEPLTVAFAAGQPTTAQYTWVSAPRKQTVPVNGGLVAWEPAGLAGGQQASTPLRAPDSPGEYLLTVFATWQGKGDISYAWYVRVE